MNYRDNVIKRVVKDIIMESEKEDDWTCMNELMKVVQCLLNRRVRKDRKETEV